MFRATCAIARASARVCSQMALLSPLASCSCDVSSRSIESACFRSAGSLMPAGRAVGEPEATA
eukprot:scaffold6986_cov66-Phaeocystis_antarctica.AAC.10